jgi:superfamily II DNA/RNA helicase
MVMTTIMPLFNQVRDILRKHKFLQNNVEVIHADMLFKLDSPNVDLFILDEADELTRTLAVKFD